MTTLKRVTVLVNESVPLAGLRAALGPFGGSLESGLAPGLIDYGPFAVDLRAHRLVRASGSVDLTPLQMRLLCFLAARPGVTVTRAELLREVFGCSEAAETRTLDAHMVALRRKVEPTPARPVHLLTVRGRGYRFRP